MRILIVGAEIGGLTLAALLERRGMKPVLVERASSLEHAGYMLSLYPLGRRVLHGLGLYDQLAQASIAVIRVLFKSFSQSIRKPGRSAIWR